MRTGVQLIAHADLFLDAESVFPGGPTKVRVGRDVNRPFYEIADAERELDRPCVSRLVGLSWLRNNHPPSTGSPRSPTARTTSSR